MSWRVEFRALLAVLGALVATPWCVGQGIEVEPIVAYPFDAADARSLVSVGEVEAPMALHAGASGRSPRISRNAAGVSGLPGDRAIDNTTATASDDREAVVKGAGFATIERITALKNLRSLTFQGWFRRPPGQALDADVALLSWRDADDGFSLHLTAEGTLRFEASGDAGESLAVYAEAGRWTFFAVTYDADREGDAAVRFYHGSRHRAVRRVAATGSDATGPIRGHERPLHLFSQPDTDRAFNGQMDGLHLFGSAKRDGRGALSGAHLEALRQHQARPAQLTGEPSFYVDRNTSPHLPKGRERLYQAHLYGTFGVRFDDLPPGRYRVELGNAELRSRSHNRVFHVDANGRRVVDALNLNEDHGFGRPVVTTFDADVADDGELAINLIDVPGHDQPRLSFVRVYHEDRLVRAWMASDEAPEGWWVDYNYTGVTPRSLAEDIVAGRPWEGTYRIKPDETGRLTEADVVGPDGVVYPDWRWAGIPGGIPAREATHQLSDFGARPGEDVADAMDEAVAAMARDGGGVLQIAPGEYDLTRPVLITHDDIVIRGAGADRTRLRLRFAADAGQAALFSLTPGPRYRRYDPDAPLPANALLEAHVPQPGLRSLALRVNGEEVASLSHHLLKSGASFVHVDIAQINRRFGVGQHEVRVVAAYADASDNIEATYAVQTTDDRPAGRVFHPSYVRQRGGFIFLGQGPTGAQVTLEADGERGAKQLVLRAGHPFEPGDRVQITAPPTARWNALVKNGREHGGTYRQNQYVVRQVDGATVHLDQPLRIRFPVEDRSYVQRIDPIENVGIEHLHLEQTSPVWVNGITFAYARRAWVRDVIVRKAGRHPVLIIQSKQCEVRDSTFDTTWFTGGGGTAYVGFEGSYDCLMDDVTTHHMRHAPNVQWGAAGNVIRNSHFHGSDGQWHAGWTHENLYENNRIDSATDTGGYGYGLYASLARGYHGPQGPRNVVYGNDITSARTGLWMGGMNEGWLILHNRFVIGSGHAVAARDGSFDHLIQGNAFAIREPAGPPFWLATPDCVGWTVKDNVVHGVTPPLTGGSGKAVLVDNRTSQAFRVPDRPTPRVESIFQWQRANLPSLDTSPQ